MINNPIIEFLTDRKKAKLKKPGEKTQEEIEKEYLPEVWISNAAKRAHQLNKVSHPGKFSHPDAQITPILFKGKSTPDGYLRSGNIEVPEDIDGNAAALDVYAFLSIKLSDDRSILEHLEESSDTIKKLFNTSEEIFQQWKEDFLKIKKNPSKLSTHNNVKQVYFPVKNDYHVLSILYPSGLMTEHRERIREMKFSESTKEAREAKKDNKAHTQGYVDLLGLLTQKFGGTQTQNISKLNSSNAGSAWLLPCIPPKLKAKYIRLPRSDFFRSLAWDTQLKAMLKLIHRIFVTKGNNINIRNHRKELTGQLLQWVLSHASVLQQESPGWSDAKGFRLPLEQQLWLDPAYFAERKNHHDWQEKIARQISEWILTAYKKSQKQNKETVQLGESEATAFQKEISNYINEQCEFIK